METNIPVLLIKGGAASHHIDSMRDINAEIKRYRSCPYIRTEHDGLT